MHDELFGIELSALRSSRALRYSNNVVVQGVKAFVQARREYTATLSMRRISCSSVVRAVSIAAAEISSPLDVFGEPHAGTVLLFAG